MAMLRHAWRNMFPRSTASAAPLRRYCAGAAGGTRPTASTVDPNVDSTVDPTADRSKEEDNYCYSVGRFGRIAMDRRKFVPLRDFVKRFPPFEPIPCDRLIHLPDPKQPVLTSEMAKDWMRSGFLASYFAGNQGLPINGAMVEGNVGVIPDLNVVAFLKLDLNTPSDSSDKAEQTSSDSCDKAEQTSTDSSDEAKDPLSVFADLLCATIKAEYGDKYIITLPGGFTELISCARNPGFDPMIILYHPEFMKVHDLSAFFVEAYKVIRKEMPAQGDGFAAHQMLVHLDSKLLSIHTHKFQNDVMTRCWLGVHSSKQSSTLSFQDASGRVILRFLQEALILDVHRHCMVHIVESRSLSFTAQLPLDHQKSFSAKPLEWRDGVQLMRHWCPEFAHHIVAVFNATKNGWDKLDLESRFPIPSFFSTPSFDEKK